METDIAIEIASYIDISDFFPCERNRFLSAFCESPEEVETEWLKLYPSKCQEIGYQKLWKVNEKIHRENGPAIEYITGKKLWICREIIHRTDGPAITCPLHAMWPIEGIYHRDPNQIATLWYSYGKLHRIGGPAVVYPDILEEWWVDDKLHRLDGPAEIRPDFSVWRSHGIIHREDGPAIEYSDGSVEWWSVGSRHRLDGPAVICGETREWYKNGELHRDDGPAIIAPGLEVWYRKGLLHRTDGPAIVTEKSKEWWKFGKLIYYEGNLTPRSLLNGSSLPFLFIVKNSEARLNHRKMFGICLFFCGSFCKQYKNRYNK